MDKAYIAYIMDRLKTIYSNGLILPRCDGKHVVPCEELLTGFCTCMHQDGYRLNLHQLQRLFRYVMSEFVE